jgi:allantoin racemase
MRLLCLNPNRTAFVTATVAAEMRAVLSPGVTVIEATADFGAAVIRTHLDNAVATHAALDLAARHAAGIDAVLLAASFDPGTEAIREALGVPVLGISEAAIAMARLLGRRIGYITSGAASTPLYRDALARYGIDRDLADWQVVETPAAYAPGDTSGVETILRDAGARLAANGADVAVLLGAVFAGMARRLGPTSPIPLVDGGLAGGLMLEALTRAGQLAAPRGRTPSVMAGVGPELTALAGGER